MTNYEVVASISDIGVQGKLGICGLCGLGDFYLLSQVKLPDLALNNGVYFINSECSPSFFIDDRTSLSLMITMLVPYVLMQLTTYYGSQSNI